VAIRSALIEVAGQQRRQFVIRGDKETVEIRPLEPQRLLFAPVRPLKKYRKEYQQMKLPPMPGRCDIQLIEFARIIRGQKKSEYPPQHDLTVQEAVSKASGAPFN